MAARRRAPLRGTIPREETAAARWESQSRWGEARDLSQRLLALDPAAQMGKRRLKHVANDIERTVAALESRVAAELSTTAIGGGAVVTSVGERVVDLYRTIESHARSAASGEFRAMAKLVR